jgi:flagellin-like protein
MKPNAPRDERTPTGSRGVSPAVGAVVMLVVTVVAAAAVGSVAFDVGRQVEDPAPFADFTVETTNVTFGGPGWNAEHVVVVVSHESGQSIDADDLRVTVNGEQAWDIAGMDGSYVGETVRPVSKRESVSAGSTFRIVFWENRYRGYPADLGVAKSPGCGGLKPWNGGVDNQRIVSPVGPKNDCALNRDNVGRGDTVRIVYEFPNSGKTKVLDTEVV